MVSDRPLIIAYSGSLDAYRSKSGNGLLNNIMQWFWTYKHDTVDSTTRTAYYLIKAVKVLKDDYQIRPSDIQIKLWGKIDPLNRVHAVEHGVEDYFSFASYLPKQESLKLLEEADLLFLPLERSNIKGKETLFIPGKLFEYLRTGKPILAPCDASDCRRILERSGIGVCTEPTGYKEIAGILSGILKKRETLSLYIPDKAYIETFSFRNKTGELAAILDKL